MTGYSATGCVLALFLSVVYWSHPVQGFSFGAPSEACETLAPNAALHMDTPQSSPVPYEVDLSALDDGNGNFVYMPGQVYPCKIRHLDVVRDSILLLPEMVLVKATGWQHVTINSLLDYFGQNRKEK